MKRHFEKHPAYDFPSIMGPNFAFSFFLAFTIDVSVLNVKQLGQHRLGEIFSSETNDTHVMENECYSWLNDERDDAK